MRLEFSRYSTNYISTYKLDINKNDIRIILFNHYFLKFNTKYEIHEGYQEILREYIIDGLEGLESFCEFLREDGLTSAKVYHLKPNTIKLQDSSSTSARGRMLSNVFSLSFGIEIDDEELVEFKLKHL